MNYRWLSLPLGNNGEPFVQYMCFPLNTTTCYYGTEIKAYGIPKKKKIRWKSLLLKKEIQKKKKDLEISVLLYWKQTKASSPKEKHKARLWKSLRTRLRTWPTAFLFLFYFHFFTIIIVIILYICFGGLTACFSAHERVFDHGTGLEQRDTRIHASIVSS